MMLFTLLALALAADPWGRPTHPRIATKPPTDWQEIYDNTRIFRLWWDDDTLPATIEVQGKRDWNIIAKEVHPGWTSSRLPKDSVFRITLNGASRSSPLLSNDSAITPTMLADLSVDKGATFGSIMGELASNEHTGDVFVATLAGGVVQASGDSLYNLTTWDGLPDDRVISVSTNDDQLLVGTASGAILFVAGVPQKVWDHNLADSYVQTVGFADGNPMLGTYQGLDLILEEQPVHLLPRWSVFSMFSEPDGSMWIGYNGITRITEEQEPSSQEWPGNVYDILLIDDVMYMATTEKGVVKVTSEGTNIINSAEATSLAYDGTQLWIAAGNDGLLQEDGTRIDGHKALPETKVWSVLSQQDDLWVGTEEGLYRWNTQTDQVAKSPNAPWAADAQINDILADSQGGILAHRQGITLLGTNHPCTPDLQTFIDEEIIELISHDDSLYAIGVQNLFVSDLNSTVKYSFSGQASSAAWWQNQVWIATDTGLWTWSPSSKEFQLRNEYSNLQSIETAQGDFSGGLWGVDSEGLLWEIQLEKMLVFGQAGKALSVAPSGFSACVGTQDGLMQVWRGREKAVEDILGTMDSNIAITAVANSGFGGCWLAAEDGSIGRTNSQGDVSWFMLPQPDPAKVHRIIPDGDQAWILTDKGTWFIELP